MARKCVCCTHADRAVIDTRLKDGGTVAEVSREFGVGPDAVTRHARKHLSPAAGAPPTGEEPAERPPAPPPAAVTPRAPSGTPEAMIGELEDLVREQLSKLQDPNRQIGEGDRTKYIGLAVSTLEKIGKLRGTSREVSNAQLIRLPAFRRCTDALLVALRPFPPALAAAASALSQLASERA